MTFTATRTQNPAGSEPAFPLCDHAARALASVTQLGLAHLGELPKLVTAASGKASSAKALPEAIKQLANA